MKYYKGCNNQYGKIESERNICLKTWMLRISNKDIKCVKYENKKRTCTGLKDDI